jgi:hypothetical protein
VPVRSCGHRLSASRKPPSRNDGLRPAPPRHRVKARQNSRASPCVTLVLSAIGVSARATLYAS